MTIKHFDTDTTEERFGEKNDFHSTRNIWLRIVQLIQTMAYFMHKMNGIKVT